MPQIQPEVLVGLVEQIFVATGAPNDTAELVARALVDADLVGHESHGVVRVRQYLDAIEQKDIDPKARPEIVHDKGAIILVDAHRSFGQLAAHFAMTKAIALAKEHGIAAAGLLNCGHVGRLGEWVEMAAREEAIALAFCNGGGTSGAVTPFGGAERVLGTNPIAAALPVGERSPVVIDFATSAVAEGKVRVARNRGKSIPEGWILNNEGKPTTNPNDLYTGGMLLPSAGHKGYALSLLVEFLGGMLTGSGSAALPGFRPGNGVLFLVMDVESFRPLEAFLPDTAALANRVKSAKLAPGFDEILLPGEPEERNRQARRRAGLTLDDATWGMLEDAARHYEIEFPPR